MPGFPASHYPPVNHQDEQGLTTRSQDGREFLDHPFRSITSTIAFLGLCVFVVASICVLIQTYRQTRNCQAFPSYTRLAPSLESARALSDGIETGQTWTWQAESETATVDLVCKQDGAVSNYGELSPIAMLSYQDSELDEGDVAEYGLVVAKGSGSLQHENATEPYFTPASVAIKDHNAMWTNQKQASQELDQVRRNLRSRMVVSNEVVVGQIGGSGIAQRRRTASNRSM